MAKKPVMKFTANFERHLEEIERFPGMGRPFMLRQPRSVETTHVFFERRNRV